jgi:hypothetical protein
MHLIENMRTTDGIQYVIAKSDHRYFGFDLNDEIEQSAIYSIIQCNDDQEILSGWMVSKVMPRWVESYSQWMNYEQEEFIQKKIPQSIAVYKGENKNDNSIANTEDSSSSKRNTSMSESSEDSLSNSSNPKSPPRNLRNRKQSKIILSETDESDDSVDNVPSLPHGVDYNNNHHTCDWASEKRCSPFIQLKKCQHPEGCDNYVHHLCTIEWAHDNGIDEQSILVLCRKHHPEYQNYLSKLHLVGKKHAFAISENQVTQGSIKHHGMNKTGGTSRKQKRIDTIRSRNQTDIEKEDDKKKSSVTNDLNYDIFKSDSFGASLIQNIKEVQPKKNPGYVDVYISSPLVNETTGIVHWCVVFGSFNDAWMIKANWLGGYIRTVLSSLKIFDSNDILHTASYYEFNIRSSEFSVDSKWKRVKGPKNKIKTVSRMNFVFSCKKSEQNLGMIRLKKILDTISWSMGTRPHNTVGEAMYSHLEKYEQNILKYLRVDDTIAEESVKRKITEACDNTFKKGFNIRYHCHLNQFMVDYDILRVLKNNMGYSSWSDLSDSDLEICYKGYITKKINLPDWNIEEESWND